MIKLLQKNSYVQTEQQIIVLCKVIAVGKYFWIDLSVETAIILERTAVRSLHLKYFTQLNTHVKTSVKKLGYLINFHIHPLKNVLRLLINNHL